MKVTVETNGNSEKTRINPLEISYFQKPNGFNHKFTRVARFMSLNGQIQGFSIKGNVTDFQTPALLLNC
jgi:hypothetical protein